MAYALLNPNHRLFLAPGIYLRRAKPIPDATFVHQISEEQLWSHSETVAREVDMLWRADEPSPCARGDGDTCCVASAARCGEDTGGPEVAAAIGRQHLVARDNILDVAQRSVAHRNLRARNQTLVVVAHRADVGVAGRLRRASRQ